MLILTRKPGESLYIGDNIKVIVVEVKGSQVRLGIDADKSLRIYREEIYVQILEENKTAAEAAKASDSGLEGLSEAWCGMKGGQQPVASQLKASPIGKRESGLNTLKPAGDAPKRDDTEVVFKRRKKNPNE